VLSRSSQGHPFAPSFLHDFLFTTNVQIRVLHVVSALADDAGFFVLLTPAFHRPHNNMSIVTHFKRWVSILSPAYAAALALIIIQVSIGLLYKAAQTNGKYASLATPVCGMQLTIVLDTDSQRPLPLPFQSSANSSSRPSSSLVNGGNEGIRQWLRTRLRQQPKRKHMS
jgi:hypothetical protein